MNSVFSTPATSKRKAKTSPDVVTPTDEDKRASAFIRKLRPRKKRPQPGIIKKQSSSSGEFQVNAFTEASGSESGGSRRASKNKINITIISSEDEEEGRDFAPQDLRIMGATNVGSLGLDCLDNIEQMRAKCKNIQGKISGKMRKGIERTKEVIKTLIYKSEACGDPTFFKIKNKELTSQMEKFKKNDILKDGEIERLRGIVEDLKKEVDELRGRLDDAEEEDRKAVVSKKKNYGMETKESNWWIFTI